MKVNLHNDLRLFMGLYEIETQKWFKALVHPGHKSFDVGGDRGYDALLLAKLSNSAPVVSFECDDVMFSEMTETFARNPYPITAVQAFVCDRNDAKHMSLDAAAERYFVPDFIKLDIEGAEADALKGASRILSKRKPSMIVEVHGAEIEERCLTIIKSHGYDDPLIVDRRTFLGETRSGHNRWLICAGREL